MTTDYHYDYIPETKEDLDWAELVTIDFALWDQPGGKEKLAKQLIEAATIKGFFYLINFGVSQEAVNRQFGIGSAFYATPLEERMKALNDLEHGNSNGYAMAGKRDLGKGLKDRKEEYNVPIHDDPRLTHPPVIQQALPEIKQFQKALHDLVLARLYELIAIGLNIPFETIKHVADYNQGACGILRYMRYSPYTDQELEEAGIQMFARGHTDSCAITLLFRQPIAALQIKELGTGNWKWVKPMDGSVTVNIGDCLSFLTGNYFKSTVHRVVVPPPDQRRFERLGVIYFSRPPPPMLLSTFRSEVLKAQGCDKNGFEADGNTVPTAGDFQINKEKWQQTGFNGQQILPGFKGSVYA